jgi:hypothetical protein
MTSALSLGVMVVSVISGLLAIFIGRREVRKLRHETGDHSIITSLLGGEFRSPVEQRASPTHSASA